MKKQISERAVFLRLNRKLAKQNIVLKKCRPSNQFYGQLGDYYAIDLNTNTITTHHVDLEQWARDKGALKPFEEIQSDKEVK